LPRSHRRQVANPGFALVPETLLFITTLLGRRKGRGREKQATEKKVQDRLRHWRLARVTAGAGLGFQSFTPKGMKKRMKVR
jgi:hypothetical protein